MNNKIPAPQNAGKLIANPKTSNAIAATTDKTTKIKSVTAQIGATEAQPAAA